VVGRPVALVLLEVNQLVAQRRLPLGPVERLEGLAGQRERTRERPTICALDGLPIVWLANGGVGQFRPLDRRGAALGPARDRPLDEVEAHVDAPLPADLAAVAPGPGEEVGVGLDGPVLDVARHSPVGQSRNVVSRPQSSSDGRNASTPNVSVA